MAHEGGATPELFDAHVDMRHRSYVSVVHGVNQGTFWAFVPMVTMPIDPRWLPRYMVHSGDMPDPDRRPRDKSTRFQYDMSLIAALLDRWRPETHTFHLPIGEMAPTLQDAAMLLGLPCAGRAVGAFDVPPSWRDELLARFAGVQRNALAPPYRTFSSAHGPTKKEDANDAIVARHLEAYMLWLFGWVMFCSSQGDSCPKHLLPLARQIADASVDDVPQFSWASAVLAATYRGLCKCCTKFAAEEPIFVGCPLLLQLWSYERFPVGRPHVNLEPYIEAGHDEVDRPTMASLWCLRKFAWVDVQTKKSYPDFVGQVDALVDTDGLSSLCLRDQEYWMTRKPIVYDIHVEEYHVHRVMRQFGRHQDFPVPVTHSVPAHGQPPASLWAAKVLPYIQSWAEAQDDVVFEDRPHSNEAFAQTRVRVMHVPAEPPMTAGVSETYPLARDQNFAVAYDVIQEIEAVAVSSIGKYTNMTPAQHLSTYQKMPSLVVATTLSFHHVLRVRCSMPVLPHDMPAPRRHMHPLLARRRRLALLRPRTRHVQGRRRFLLWVRMGPDLPGDVDQWERPEWERSDWVQSYYGSRHQEEAGPSQFSDAPLPTQGTQVEQTPLPDVVPPDPLTYSQHHTRAARDAARRGRRGPPSANASRAVRPIPEQVENKSQHYARLTQAREEARLAREEHARRVRQQQIRLKGKEDELKRRRAQLGKREAALKIQEEQFQAREADLKREEEKQKHRYKEPSPLTVGLPAAEAPSAISNGGSHFPPDETAEATFNRFIRWKATYRRLGRRKAHSAI
ncbi:hypothetical protein HU200_054618 [Digitaria exilis]|uniref:Aminotransferase-like plant mobile domain-containing protein n=1 Tax=Digitaria exilis TaxID=1010633 RepID=A0A835E3X5_9POAL|nr:hypothetical protein HU200_054618 [Digitaria exilis]